jgi:hypothetical protein
MERGRRNIPIMCDSAVRRELGTPAARSCAKARLALSILTMWPSRQGTATYSNAGGELTGAAAGNRPIL